jgi:hypothetical protein
VVADSHHFEEEHDPEPKPGPHSSEKLDPYPQLKAGSGSGSAFKVMRIGNTAFKYDFHIQLSLFSK